MAKDGVKRPLSSFMLYSAATRPEVKKENPTVDTKEIAVLVGAKWRGLSAAEKEKWTKKAAATKEAHEEEHGKPEKKSKSTKVDKSGKKVKRGKSAYIFFTQATTKTFKEENPGVTFGEVAKGLGAQWGKMTDAQKKPFNDMAAKDKKKYEDA